MSKDETIRDLEARLAKARKIFADCLSILRGESRRDEVQAADGLTAEVKATLAENEALLDSIKEFWEAASEAGWPRVSELDAERKAELLRTLWQFKGFLHGETLGRHPGPDAG